MELINAIKHIIDGNAVVIMGSGASYGAKNAFGELLSGTKLASHLYRECGITPDDIYDLQDASQCYQEKFGADKLITEIRTLLTCSSFTNSHTTIYSLPWMRYYTTNYDDVALLAASATKRIEPITLSSDFKKNHTKENLCIHINGHIGALNETTLDHEFKLTANSYLSQTNILNSQWGAFLANDLDTAKCVVIIGLSLKYDLDLSKIIRSSDHIKKTIIIDSPTLSDNAINRLSRFGKVYPIGIDQFATEITNTSASYKAVTKKPEERLYTAFTYEYRRRRIVSPPSPDDVYRLFLNGQYPDSLFYRQDQKYIGFVHRKQFIDAKNAIVNQKKRFVFVESDMGNGKTACINELRFSLANEDIHIFTLTNADSAKLSEEISAICELSKTSSVLIIIDDYPNYMEVLYKFSLHSSENEQYLITARSALNINKIPIVQKYFSVQPGECVFVNMNFVSTLDLTNCSSLFDKYGFWGKRAKWTTAEKIKYLSKHENGAKHFQSIMLDIIKSDVIKTKIDMLVNVIKQESAKYHSAVILILLVNVMNLRLSIADIERIFDVDVFTDPGFRDNPAISELLAFDEKGSPKIKSPVTARYILQNVSSPESIVETLYKVANYSQQYSDQDKFTNILTSIISYSHIHSFMKGFNNHEQFLSLYFDQLSNIEYYRSNNFFWLQYAIACIEIRKFERAEHYLQTAQGLIPDGFVPFQINNQYARFYFERILCDQTTNVPEDMRKAHDLLMIPIMSDKDNELNVVELFSYYYKGKIKAIMMKNSSTQYKNMCKEAYERLMKFIGKHPEYSERLNTIKVQLIEAYCS